MRLLAITFGHIVLGVSYVVLEAERGHEHAHVRQYEKWGLLFFPLYLGSSFIQLARGRHPYLDNAFEKQAVRVAATGRLNGTTGKQTRLETVVSRREAS